MQVFKLFMLILKKKIKLIILFTVIFMVFFLGFFFGGNTEDKFTESRLKITITDNDNTPESKALIEYIGTKHDIVTSNIDMKDALFFGTVDYELTINNGYARNLADGKTEGLFTSRHVYNSYSVAYMSSFLDEYISCVRACTAAGDDMTYAVKKAADAMDTNTEVTMITSEAGNINGLMSGKGFFRYLPYIFLSLMICVLSPVMMSINSKEVRFRTNCSAVRPVSFMMQILLGCVIYVLAIWVLFMTLGILLDKSAFSGSGWLNIVNSGVFAVISAFIAVLVSMLLPSQQTVNLASNVISLVMSFMCGVFVPQTMLGDTVISIGKFLPAFWYIKISDMLTGAQIFNASKAAQYLLIEAGFAVALGIIATLLYKTKLRSAEL
ncbi:MAG: ABC transporter permease [Ruminococcus sp.]|uniref:ABC transporter permease n=1 Tax=Ruminococcus sp. TaxID=41978 RepID=UPI0025D15402|nr:ABC transporter permease [Ruminococcus sp.]MBO4867343.1 ABC transporter permease [Ruminococcus sp.]